ncbi:MAG: hypothetical protein KJ990_02555 [Proteobacteria bacterium]|nr:hypothetical protein [Pseudomonadota bacterium]MBU1648014.1 hypothetical protein [Pseudomonadota bacterium]
MVISIFAMLCLFYDPLLRLHIMQESNRLLQSILIPNPFTNSTQNIRISAPINQFPLTSQNRVNVSLFTGLAYPDFLIGFIQCSVFVLVHDFYYIFSAATLARPADSATLLTSSDLFMIFSY